MDFDELLTRALLMANEGEYYPGDPTVQMSEKKDRKIRNMLRDPERTYRRVTRPVPLKILRTAAMVLLALSLLASLAMINPDVRAFVQKVYKEWFPEKVTYTFADGNEDIDAADYRATFEYLPENMEFDEYLEYHDGGKVRFINKSTGNKLTLVYRNADESIKLQADINNKNSTSVTVHGYPGELYLADVPQKNNHIYWVEEGISFRLSGKLSKEELIKVAEGIKLEPEN